MEHVPFNMDYVTSHIYIDIYITNYISKTENYLCTLQFFFFFFTFCLPDEFLYRLYHSNTFVLLLVSIMYLLTCPKTKVSRLK